MLMLKKKENDSLQNVLFLPMLAIALILVAIAISSVTNTALALKNNGGGNSDIAHQQCLNGLQVAAFETGNCSFDDLQQFSNIMSIRETQGIKAAKDACFSNMSSPACRGICVGAVNCYDIQ